MAIYIGTLSLPIFPRSALASMYTVNGSNMHSHSPVISISTGSSPAVAFIVAVRSKHALLSSEIAL